MRTLDVRFEAGKDVLNAYWGFLSSGGLVIGSEPGVTEGDPVVLDIQIVSSGQKHRLAGQVVRSLGAVSQGPSGPSAERLVVAFHPGEPAELLLSAAWAETDNVPARRFSRQPAGGGASRPVVTLGGDRPAQVRSQDGLLLLGRLLNVSPGGCCVRLDGGALLGSGDRVSVSSEGVELAGQVRWIRGADVGVEFDLTGSEVSTLLSRLA